MAQAIQTSLAGLRADAVPAVRPAEQATSIGFYNGPSYALLRDIAKDFASSDIVPQRFQGKAPNCMIAVNMAVRMQADPLMVMQNLYIVHGTPGWSSQFLISCFNQCGRFGSIRYKFTGKRNQDDWGCIAYATNLQTGEEIEGSEVTISIAKKEGWFGKNGSKWQTMPQQMLMYRAAAWMIRTHAPEIGMGFQTREEVEDAYDMTPGQNGVFAITTADIRQAEPTPEAPEPVLVTAAQSSGQTPAKPAAPTEKAPSRTRKQQEAAPAQAALEQQPEPQGQGLSHDSHTGEVFGPPADNGYMITCPNNDKLVDERDCSDKPCRNGCPQFM